MAALAVLAAARVAGAELQRRGHARANAWPLVLAGRRNGEILAGLTQPQVWALAGALAGLARRGVLAIGGRAAAVWRRAAARSRRVSARASSRVCMPGLSVASR